MNLRNRVQLIGNIGNNPIVKTFDNGSKVARFSLATYDIYKKGEEYIKDTQWHSIVAWGKTAEIVEKNLSVGCEVVVDGKLKQRSYINKNGDRQFLTEIIANTLIYNKKESIIK